MATFTEKKASFSQAGSDYTAYTNGKEYQGAKKVVYISISKVRGTTGSSSSKGSYSIGNEEFVDYRAGELDLIKAAARALGFIE